MDWGAVSPCDCFATSNVIVNTPSNTINFDVTMTDGGPLACMTTLKKLHVWLGASHQQI